MSKKTKNEICLSLWQFYNREKAEGLDTTGLVGSFAHELYLGYKTECKAAIENAAANRYVLQSMESMVLAKNKVLMVKERLNFRDPRNQDQILRSMVGSVLIGMGIDADNKTVWIQKTDGENEFKLTAENPLAEFKEGMVIWIAEPFVLNEDGTGGKPWSKMTKEERENATSASLVRSGSAMPKYMQERRAQIKSLTVNSDGVNAWLQIMLAEVEGFSREEFEDSKVLEELGITEAEATDDAVQDGDEPEPPKTANDTETGVDVSKISEEHYEVSREAADPEPESTPGVDPEANPTDAGEEEF